MMKRTGLVGYPVEHSLSPCIHRYWIAQHGLAATYELFSTPPELLNETIARLRAEEVTGFNITVPHKQAALAFMDGRDALVDRIGATNTVTLRQSKFHCTNTDAYGFIHNLQSSAKWNHSRLENVVVLGAGGATRAAIVALKDAGARRITLCNRTDEKAVMLAREFHVEANLWQHRSTVLAGCSLLVNTTSLGMQGKAPLEINLERLPVNALVHDIVYAPLETPLLEAARARGNSVVDGLGMLLYQAQAAFAQWHGVTPEVTPELRAMVLASATHE